jgi:hypothetical protein
LCLRAPAAPLTRPAAAPAARPKPTLDPTARSRAPPQVQTLVEIRGMELERRGKLSRYGPLAVLELVK